MRRVYLAEKRTPVAMGRASQLGCGEIAEGVPPAIGRKKPVSLPSVVVESTNVPGHILAVFLDDGTLTKTTVDQVADIAPGEAVDNWPPGLRAVIATLELRVTDLQKRVSALEKK